MSKRPDNQTGDAAETRRVKLAIGGAVLEVFRKWGVTALVGWIAVAQGLLPMPGIEPKVKPAAESVSRHEFEWVKESIYKELASIDGKLDRIEARLDRALDKRLAGGLPMTNAAELSFAVPRH